MNSARPGTDPGKLTSNAHYSLSILFNLGLIILFPTLECSLKQNNSSCCLPSCK